MSWKGSTSSRLVLPTETPKSSSKLRQKWPHALIITSIFVACVIALFKWVLLEQIIRQQIQKEVVLEEGSDTWNKWKDVPIPIYLAFRFFNITNYDAFERGGKPKVQEMGPYVYEERRHKEIKALDEEQDTVTYRQKTFYYFRPDLSNGTEDDRPIIMNVPFVSTAKITKETTNLQLAYTFTDATLRQRGERLFNRYTVRETLFEGFPVNAYVQFLSNPMLQLVGSVNVPKSFSGSKFGLYKGRNGSDDGEFTVARGKLSSKDFGKILSWEGKTRLNLWNGMCNMINGTDGSIFHPFIKKTDLLRFFIPDLCRSLYLVFREEVEVHGIKAYRFQTPDPKLIFEHKDFCFCPPKAKSCYKQGVFDLSPCQEGAPISFSTPHFYQGWEPYANGVDGLNPQKEKHDTFLDLEPNTGLLLRGVKRLQFNIDVEPTPSMSTFREVRKVLLPFMWIEESAEIPEELAEEIKQKLYVPVQLANKFTVGGLLGCAILVFVGIIGCLFLRCCSPENSKISTDDDDGRSNVSFSTRGSNSPTLASRGTNTSWIEHKATMTEWDIVKRKVDKNL